MQKEIELTEKEYYDGYCPKCDTDWDRWAEKEVDDGIEWITCGGCKREFYFDLRGDVA